MKKYLLILMSFFMVILGITSFSNVENEKVPNELIINNPKKEVTTIESLKNREHGEMNISVTKINPIPITGIERDGKLEFELPEKVELEENIFVTDDVNKIQEHRTLKLNKNLTTFSLENQTEKTKLKVDKPSDSKKIYIAVKEQDKIKRVYENNYMNYNSTDLGKAYMYIDGRVYLDNIYDSSFNKIGSRELFVGKDGKGKGFDLTIPLRNETQMTEGYGTVDKSSVYISRKEETSYYTGDYFYNKNRNFGLILKKSNSLKYIAEGRDETSSSLSNIVPAIKIPKSYHGGFGKEEEVRVGARYTDNRDYYYTTIIRHSGEDISKFTETITIDMTNELVGNTTRLDNMFDTRDRNFRTCMYSQAETLDQTYSSNMVAAVMRIKENKGEVKTSSRVGPSLFPDFEVKFDGKYQFNYYNKTVYTQDTHFAITKLGQNLGTKRYTIEVYSGRDYHVLLGVLNLIIKNGNGPDDSIVTPPAPVTPIDIGSATFNVDCRFINRWIYGDEKSSKNIGEYKESYNPLVKVNRFIGLPSIQITNVKVNNKSYTRAQNIGGIRYEIFSTSWGELAIPVNTNLSNFNENMVIYRSVNKWIGNYSASIELTGLDNKKYVGNINIISKGLELKNTKVTLDLSKWLINKPGIWGNPESPQTTAGQSAKLENGTLFYWKTYIDDNFYNKHIITRLKLTKNEKEIKEVSIKNGENKVECTVFSDNDIGFDNNGFFIKKKTQNINPIKYKVEGYYKDILLGTTTLTITNQKKPIDIGTAKFRVDKRLIAAQRGDWVFANGDTGLGLNANQFKGNFINFVDVSGFDNINKYKNITIQDAEINGKSKDSSNFIAKNKHSYIAFKKNNSWDNDASAVPKVLFNKLNEALVINKKNTINTDIITFIGSDGNNYIGNIIEEFIGEEAISTNVTLDLSKWIIGEQRIWNDPKKIESFTKNNIKTSLVGGTFFNWKSSVKNIPHIVTKLRIKEDNKEPVEIKNTTGKLEYKFTNNTIGIDNTGLYIKKETNSSQPVKYVIEGYYQGVKLGQTTITITNQKNSFELVGDGVLDFGNMVYTSNFNEYKKEKLFKVKNPSNAKLKFSVASSTGTIKNGMDNLKLENIKISETKNNGNGESSFLLGASAKVEKNTKPGKYTGEIQVIVDIDGTGK
ncbi:DUF4402 domain-containing protein [Fusobacterium sp.]|uniref:DUF4402 domain-containing protein n=1 Tax=Fusobacterium sp. TaxID=68766 RepID=UPI0025BCE3CB|nr:DUF4402 domain-containing protein [Fusobacterium sp.]